MRHLQATRPMRLSIITPSYQQAPYLEECIRSVREQGGDVEHIVVDGGSTDGSKAIIEQHADQLRWWCSEKDKGQSDAINKGLAQASGAAFTWVNSDDALLPGAIAHVQRAFAADPELLVFGGQVTHRDAKGERIFDRLNSTVDQQLFADPVINQPATWYRLDVVKEIGGVDPALRYVMDVELWWQVLLRHGTDHLRFERVPLAMFRLHDESKTVTQHSGFLREMGTILHGLCERTGNEDVAAMLALGYCDRPSLRGIPANEKDHHTIVRDMSIHFLLKWHGHIHTEAEFHMMQRLHEGDFTREVRMLPGMAERWSKARLNVDGTTWNRYRVRRKLKHLFG